MQPQWRATYTWTEVTVRKEWLTYFFFGKKTGKKDGWDAQFSFWKMWRPMQRMNQKIEKKLCTIDEVLGQYIQASSPKQLLQNVLSGIFHCSTFRVYRPEIANFLHTFSHVSIFDPALWSVLARGPETAAKFLSMSLFFRWRHFALLSISLIFLRGALCRLNGKRSINVLHTKRAFL